MTLPNADDWPGDGDDGLMSDRLGAEASLAVELELEPELGVTTIDETADRASELAIAPYTQEDLNRTPSVPLRSQSRSQSSFSRFFATRPLWQVVLGLGISAIGLTSAAIGIFTLSGLALQGLGRAVANLMAGIMALTVFGSVPAVVTLVTLQTDEFMQRQGVSARTTKLAIGLAIGIGIAIGLLGRQW